MNLIDTFMQLGLAQAWKIILVELFPAILTLGAELHLPVVLDFIPCSISVLDFIFLAFYPPIPHYSPSSLISSPVPCATATPSATHIIILDLTFYLKELRIEGAEGVVKFRLCQRLPQASFTTWSSAYPLPWAELNCSIVQR